MAEIKQFIFLRGDIEGFGVGQLMAQVCHGSVAAVHKYWTHPETVAYLEGMQDLTTVIYKVTLADFTRIKTKLEEMDIGYFEWIEDRSFPSCIATRPLDTRINKKFERFRRPFELFKAISEGAAPSC